MTYRDSVQLAIDYIESHLFEEMELAWIAERAHLSQAHLYRMFYALTGHPVKEYVRKRRISAAADHLRYSSIPVGDIAVACGFDSYSVFAKVFKRIVGMTPTAYREADLFFSFEPIQLRERVEYVEEREQTERFPDVRVIRMWPQPMFSYVHIAGREEGLEEEAFRKVTSMIRSMEAPISQYRLFGYNVDLPPVDGRPQYGYKMLLFGTERPDASWGFQEEEFPGGLYAVRKTSTAHPATVIETWNRLLAEWLPASRFQRGTQPYLEEFVSYEGEPIRMNLYMPVERQNRQERIEVVSVPAQEALCFRSSGKRAQAEAEAGLIAWYKHHGTDYRSWGGRYYIAFSYGMPEDADFWWENGILGGLPPPSCREGAACRKVASGLYACMVTGTYGSLIGFLTLLHRWVDANRTYRIDEERLWYAEYHPVEGASLERDSIVKLYLPIRKSI